MGVFFERRIGGDDNRLFDFKLKIKNMPQI
jgi:hypothetical protein